MGGAHGPPPPSRTKWTRRVPHPVLIGHAASLSKGPSHARGPRTLDCRRIAGRGGAEQGGAGRAFSEICSANFPASRPLRNANDSARFRCTRCRGGARAGSGRCDSVQVPGATAPGTGAPATDTENGSSDTPQVEIIKWRQRAAAARGGAATCSVVQKRVSVAGASATPPSAAARSRVRSLRACASARVASALACGETHVSCLRHPEVNGRAGGHGTARHLRLGARGVRLESAREHLLELQVVDLPARPPR